MNCDRFKHEEVAKTVPILVAEAIGVYHQSWDVGFQAGTTTTTRFTPVRTAKVGLCRRCIRRVVLLVSVAALFLLVCAAAPPLLLNDESSSVFQALGVVLFLLGSTLWVYPLVYLGGWWNEVERNPSGDAG